MKLSQITLALTALLSTAFAQGLGDLPDCARDCATDAIPASCGIDVECICTTKSFISDISCCVAKKCSEDDQDTTLEVAKNICARGGVTDLPSSITCSTAVSSITGGAATATTTTATDASTTKDTTVTGTKTTEAATTGSNASQSGSSTAASSSAAVTTGAAVLGQAKDATLMAAAGAAAAVAFFV
ncbi:hypothetical protein N7532_010356 [Penicillium argentinense]|uniref:CFEM domain-containing protein n=1 Tax=Penicillium argentinense TaxID=1131581 RepID=A0A9W9EPN9_9EURO|nr:uncharacterized protein N7532_010356 [Penicillium argentinense]KAJ5085585.1 hypothetical protein N7532_010356 [Penicillium argentinense]